MLHISVGVSCDQHCQHPTCLEEEWICAHRVAGIKVLLSPRLALA